MKAKKLPCKDCLKKSCKNCKYFPIKREIENPFHRMIIESLDDKEKSEYIEEILSKEGLNLK